MFYNSSRNIVAILTIIVFVLAGCSDDDSSPSLDGDLSFEVTGESGVALQIFVTEVIDDNLNFSSGDQVTTPAQGDLDDGDFDGYVLQASPFGADEPDITLKLLSDGDVVEETSNPNENGVFLIEVGDVPDLSDFN